MVAIVSGNGLGLDTSSLAALGARGQIGIAPLGQSGEGSYINVATGNLVLQDTDTLLMGLGPDAATLRTYNSQGLANYSNNDGWLMGQIKAVVNQGSGTLQRTDSDGSTTLYTWNATTQLYVETTAPGTAVSTIKQNADGSYTWTNGATGATETYAGTGAGLIQSSTDVAGNKLTYGYNASGYLSQVTTADGESVSYTYSGSNLTGVTTTLQGAQVLSQITYAYDTQNRLTSVTVGLNPAGNVPAGSDTLTNYTTTYGYDGTSNRVASVTQSDGTKLLLTYVLVNGTYKVATCTDGDGNITSFAYNTTTNTTTVTDPYGVVSSYQYDSKDQLTQVNTGVTTGNAAGLSQVNYAYNTLGDVTSITDALGRTLTLQYDTNGNLLSQVDSAADTLGLTYTAANQIQTSTAYATAASGSTAAGQPQTTRYVYSAANPLLLRFVLSPEGDVTEYRYNAQGLRTNAIRYMAGTYNVGSLAQTAAPTEAQMQTWISSQDLTQTQRTDYAYDFRGQLQASTVYASTDATGAGVASTASATQYVYDQRGLLLKTITPDSQTVAQYIYDGLGRVVSKVVTGTPTGTTTPQSQTTLTQYDDTHGKVTVTLANGLSIASTYDAAGRLVSVIQSQSTTTLGTTQYAYDADGRLLMTTDVTGARAWKLYDAAGQKVADIDGNGGLTEYVYDRSGHITETIRYATPVATASLVDGNGNPTTAYNPNPASAPSGTTPVTLASLRPASTAQDQKTWSFYDGAGRLAWQVDGLGYVTQTQYDGASRVLSVTKLATPINVSQLGNGQNVALALGGFTTTTALAETLVGSGPNAAHLLTATVTPSNTNNSLTGTVTFFAGTTILGSATVSGGQTSLEVANLPVGTNAITAVYSGDANNAGSASNTLSDTIAAGAATTTTLTVTQGAVPSGSTTTTHSGQSAAQIWHVPGTNSSVSRYLGTFQAGDTVTANIWMKGPVGTTLQAFLGNVISSGGTAYDNSTVSQVYATGNWQLITLTWTMSHADTMWLYLYGNTNSTMPAGTYTLADDISVTSTQRGTVMTDGFEPGVSTTTNFTNTNAWCVSGSVNAVAAPDVATAPVMLTATVAGQLPTGTVVFYSNGAAVGTAAVVNGVASLVTGGLAVGTDNLTAVYQGDAVNATSSSAMVGGIVTGPSSSATSLSSSISSVAQGTSFTLTATVGGASPSGTVTFLNGTTVLGTATVTNGVATLSTSIIPTGTASILATYSGDAANATSVSGTVSVAVTATTPAPTAPAPPPATTTALSLSSATSVLGTPVTLAATVSGGTSGFTPTGTVTFFNGSMAVGSATLLNGQASLTVSSLPVGTDSLTAVYSGDIKSATSLSSATTETVSKAATTTTLGASAASIVAGNALLLTAAVGGASATGTVTFYNGTTSLGTASLVNGLATLVVTSLPTGTANLTVSYGGDGNNAISTSTAVAVTVTAPSAALPSSTTALSSSAANTTFGSSVTLTATVTGSSPSGMVIFFNGSTVLGSAVVSGGQASLAVSNLPVGSQSLRAVYSGDSANAASTSAAVTETVAVASTTTYLSQSNTQVAAGTAVTLTANVLNLIAGFPPTGTVTFYSNGVSIGTAALSGGVAKLTVSNLPVGNDSLTASYGGDSNNVASTSGAQIESVTQSSTTTTRLTALAGSASQGAALTLTASVTNPGGLVPTGTVTFLNGTTVLGTATLQNGSASLTLSTVPAGANALMAVYSGDAQNVTSAGTLNQAVSLAPTTVTLGSSVASQVQGGPVTLVAQVVSGASSSPTGTVTFYDCDTNVTLGTATVFNNGTALLALTSLPYGTTRVTAAYSGDAVNAGGVSSAISETILVQNSIQLTGPSTATQGQPVKLTTNLSAGAGVVTFLNGTTVLGVSYSGTLTTPLMTAGTASIVAVFSSTDGTNVSVISSPLSISVSAASVTPPTPPPATTTSLAASTSNPQIVASGIAIGAPQTTLIATISGGSAGIVPTGTVTFFNGATVLGSAVVINGISTFVASLPSGSANLKAVYSGDSASATSASSVVTQTIALTTSTVGLAASATRVVSGASVTLTAEVLGANPGGTVSFYNGSTLLGSIAVANGQAQLTTTTLPVGPLNLTATYNGDANNTISNSSGVPVTVLATGSSTATTQPGAATTTALTASAASAALSAPLTLTASVTTSGTTAPTGAVVFLNGTQLLGSATISGGVAKLVTSNLPLGTDGVTAVYVGDSSNAPSLSGTVTESVTAATTYTSLAVFGALPMYGVYSAQPTYGAPVTLTATVAPTAPGILPTGLVTFYSGSTVLGTGSLINGAATLTVSSLPGGVDNLSASYGGDGNNAASVSSAGSLNVAAAGTATSLTASVSSVVQGAAFTLTANVAGVAGSPTGLVTFLNGTTVLGTANVVNGVATLSTSIIPTGTATITATYSGDSSNLTSVSGSTAVTVTAASTTPTAPTAPPATTTAFTSSYASISLGSTVTLTATVSGGTSGVTPTGTVTFFNGNAVIGSVKLASGTGSLTLATLPLGADALKAVYSGDGTSATSQATLTETVTPAVTTTALSLSSGQTSIGNVVMLTATVTNTLGGASPTGTVTFKNGSATLGTATLTNGVATLSVSNLLLGTDSLTAVYGGDANNALSTSYTFNESVVQATSSLQVTNGASVPSNGALSVQVSGSNPSGQVVFLNGTTVLGTAPVQNGVATLSGVMLPVGTLNLVAAYAGDTNNAVSLLTFSQTVTPATTSTVVMASPFALPSTSVAPGIPVVLTARVAGNQPGGSVTFTNGSTVLGTATVSNGLAALVVTGLPTGVLSIKAAYSGDAANAASTSTVLAEKVQAAPATVSLTSSAASVAQGGGMTLTAHVTGNAPSGLVTFVSGTTVLGTATLSNGTAVLTVTALNLPAGAASVTAVYAGDANNGGASSAAVSETVTAGTATVQVAQGMLDRAVTSIYNNDGLLRATIDGEGYLTEFRYNAVDEQVERIAYATPVAGFTPDTPGASTFSTLAVLASKIATARSTDSLAGLLPASSPNDIATFTLYNAEGQVVGQVDGAGYLTETVYDVNGHVSKTTRYATKVAGTVTTASTLAGLRPASAPEDHVATNTYDAFGRLSVQTNAEGTQTQYTYDSLNRVVSTVVALNTGDQRTFNRQFDILGRVTAELSADGAALITGTSTQAQINAIWAQYATTYAYDAAGRRISQTDPNGNRTVFFYDNAGHLRYTVDATGDITETGYDALGRATSTTKYATALTGTTLTGLVGGLLTATANQSAVTALASAKAASAAQNSTTLLTYNADSEVIQIQRDALSAGDGLGGTTTALFDAFGDAISTTQSISGMQSVTTTATFDRRGLQLSRTDDAGVLNLTTKTQVDAFGRVTAATDANGNIATMTYDTRGRMVSVTDPLNQARTTTYDAFDRVLTQTDALNHTTSYAYNTGARSVTMTTPEGTIVTTVHTRAGQTLTIQDANGTTTTYGYDADGNLTSTSTPVQTASGAATNVVVTNTFDAADRLTQTQTTWSADGNTHTVGYAYDGANRLLTRTVDPNGLKLVTTYAYDPKGQQVSITDPAGTVTQLTYDLKGDMLSQAVDPSGLNLRTVYAYDQRGKALTVTTPDGTVTQYSYDDLGRRTQTIMDPNGLKLTTSYAYDSNGNVAAVTDPDGHVTRYTYDVDNRRIYTVDAAGDVTRADYDGAGRLTQTTRYATVIAAGNLALSATTAAVSALIVAAPGQDAVENRVYDKNDRLKFVVDGAGDVTAYTYDGNGNVADRVQYATPINRSAWLGAWSATAGTPCQALSAPTVTADATRDIEVRTVYDQLNRALFSLTSVGNGTRMSVMAFGYDAKGNLVSRTAYANTVAAPAAGSTQAAVLAAAQSVVANAVTSASNPAPDVTVRTVYDTADRAIYTLTSAKDGSRASVVALTYDAAGRVTRSTAYATTLAATTAATSSAVSAAISAAGFATASDATSYRIYDKVGRLLWSVDGTGAATKVSYDGNGRVVDQIRFATPINVTTWLTGWVAGTPYPTPVVAADAKHDQEVRTVFDAAGRARYLLTSTADGTQVSVVAQAFDAKGNLVRRTAYATTIAASTAATLNAVGAAVAALGSSSDAISRRVFDAADRLVWSADGLGAVTQFAYDGLGNMVKQVAYAQAVSAAATPSSAAATPGMDRVSLMAYDAAGRLVYQMDALGSVVQTAYDGQNHAIQRVAYASHLGAPSAATPPMTASAFAAAVTLSAGQDRVTLAAFDASGHQAFTVDALGGVTQTFFDALGRAIGTTTYATPITAPTPFTILKAGDFLVGGATGLTTNAAADRTTLSAYDASGNLAYSVDALGYVTQKTFDGLGRTTAQTLYAAAVSGLSVGASMGKVVSLVVATPGSDRTSTFIYDADSRLASSTDALGATESTTYDGVGNKRTFTNKLGATWTYDYDAAGRMIQETDPAVNVTSVSQDSNGNLVQGATQSQNIVTQLAYDALGNLVSRTEGGVLSGGTVSLTNARTTTYGYDALGHQVLITYPSVNVYDASDLSHLNTDGYGAAARAEKTPISPLKTQVIYDNFGDAVANIDVQGNVSVKTYDGMGRALYEVDALGYVTSYTRDTFGSVIKLTRYANAPVVNVPYYGATQNLLGGISGTGTPAQALSRVPTSAIVYAAVQTCTSASDRTISTQYDQLGRAVQVTQPSTWVNNGSGNAGSGYSGAAVTRTVYNAFGQVIQVKALADAPNGPDGAGATWAITTHVYDQRGKETLTIDPLGYVTRQTYDAAGNLLTHAEYANVIQGWTGAGTPLALMGWTTGGSSAALAAGATLTALTTSTVAQAAAAGQTLSASQALFSSDGRYQLSLQSNGDLVVFDRNSGATVWHAGTAGSGADHVTFGTNGSLTLYSGTTVVWSAASASAGTGAALTLQTDGELVIATSTGTPVWSSGALVSGQSLTVGQSITSADGHYQLTLQASGNLVLTDLSNGAAVWATNTGTSGADHFIFLASGDLVLTKAGATVWSAGAAGLGGTTLKIQPDGNLVLNDAWNKTLCILNGLGAPATYGQTLALGASLTIGQTLSSTDGRYLLTMQANGNLVLSDRVSGTTVWSTQTSGTGADHAILQTNGNLALMAGSTVVWSAATTGLGGTTLAVQTNGTLALTSSANAQVWTNAAFTGALTPNQTLTMGQYLVSADGRYRLMMQANGNLVLSNLASNTVLWSSGVTAADHFTFQSDGNLVLYSGTTSVWNAGTAGKGGTSLGFQYNGTLALSSSANPLIWSTTPSSFALTPGQSLTAGQYILSCDGRYELWLQNSLLAQGSGLSLIDLATGKTLWTAPSSNGPGNNLVFGTDGSLILYQGMAPGTVLWSAGTVGAGGTALTVQANGNLVMSSASNGNIWSTNTAQASTPSALPPVPSFLTSLAVGQSLAAGQSLYSPDGRYQMTLGADGNLTVLSRQSGAALWSSNTAGLGGTTLVYQSSNFGLVLKNAAGTVVWRAGASTSGGSLTLRADGNLMLTNGSGSMVWTSGASGILTNQDRITTYAYDLLNRKTSETKAGAIFSSGSAGALSTGNVTAGNATTNYVYDAVGNLLSTTDALGATTRTVYDALGRTSAVVAPTRGNAGLTPVTKFMRDVYGNVVAQVQTQLYTFSSSDVVLTEPSFLSTGQSLGQGQSVSSKDGRYQLTLQTTGNLTLTDTKTAAVIWSTNTAFEPMGWGGVALTLQPSGEVTLVGTDHPAGGASISTILWRSGAAGLGGTSLTVQSDGKLVLADATGTPVWTNRSPLTLTTGQAMTVGQSLTSSDGHYQLTLQSGGNLVLTDRSLGLTLWSISTANATYPNGADTFTFGTDGSLALTKAGVAAPLWTAGSAGLGGTTLTLGADGRVMLTKADGTTAMTLAKAPNQSQAQAFTVISPSTLPMSGGSSVVSPDGGYLFTVELDGNLVLTNLSTGAVIWNSGTTSYGGGINLFSSLNQSQINNGLILLPGMQPDPVSLSIQNGNLVLTDTKINPPRTIWSSAGLSTAAGTGTSMAILANGILALQDNTKKAVWQSSLTGDPNPAPRVVPSRVSLTRYDSHGNAIQTQDAKGTNRFMSYDALGHLAKTWQQVTGDDGSNNAAAVRTLYSAFQYDALGRQTAVITPASTSVLQGASINLISQNQAGSLTMGMVYNAFGEVTQRGTFITGGAFQGQETFEYDNAGHLWRTNQKDGLVKVTLFDLQGHQTAQITSAGIADLSQAGYFANTQAVDLQGSTGLRRTDFKVDLLGRALVETLPLRQDIIDHDAYRPKVNQTFDRWGSVLSQSDARNAVWITTYGYNAFGQVVQVVRPDGNGLLSAVSPTTQIYFDALGRQVAIRDANGHLNGQAWDAAGELIQELHADGGVVSYAYDGNGQRVQVTDADGFITGYGYDAVGENTTVTHQNVMVSASSGTGPSGFLTTLTSQINRYDEAGHLTAQVDGIGNTLTSVFDLRGNIIATGSALASKGGASQLTNHYTGQSAFDAWGHTLAKADALRKISTWGYDTFGLLTAHTDLGGAVYSFTYDMARQLVAQTHTTWTGNGAPFVGQNLVYSYDAAGQMVQIVDQALNQVTEYGYNAVGQHVMEVDSQGNVAYQNQTLSYDTQGRLARVQAQDGVDMQIAYDNVGNKMQQTTLYPGTSQNTTYGWVWVYDPDLGRSFKEWDVTGTQTINTFVTQTLYFAYDSMNRQILSDGRLNNNASDYGNLAPGAAGTPKGHILGYDANGNRASDTAYGTQVATNGLGGYTAQAGLATQWYGFDTMNRLATVTEQRFYPGNGDPNSADGIVIDARQYDGDSRVVGSGPNAYFGTTTKDQGYYSALVGGGASTNSNLSGAMSTTTTYDGYGNVTGQSSTNMTSGTASSTSMSYDAAGNATQDTSTQGTITTTTTNTVSTYDTYKVTQAYSLSTNSNGGAQTSGTVYQTYDANGFLVKVRDNMQAANTRTFINDAFGHILQKSQNGNILKELMVNGQLMGSYGVGVDTTAPLPQGGAAPTFITQASFDPAYEPINASYPNGATGQWMVQAGDTLESIAQASYGDSSLWYQIAQANGLGGNSDLRVGETLTVPSRVGNVHNTDQAHAPYNPSKIIGSTRPNLPVPQGPSADGGCGGIALIIIIAVAIVATIMTAGAAALAMAGTLSSATMGGVMAAGATALAGGTIAGVGAVGVLAAAAIGGAVGSIVSQEVGIAIGAQKDFSWSQVGMSALGSAVTAGVGEEFTAAGAANNATTGFKAWAAAGERAMISNAETQGIEVITGMEHRFDWGSVATAGAGAFVGAAATEGMDNELDYHPKYQSDFVFSKAVTAGTVSGFAAGMTTAALHGGRVDVERIATDAFGNALGQGLAGEMQSSQAAPPVEDHYHLKGQLRFDALDESLKKAEAEWAEMGKIFNNATSTTDPSPKADLSWVKLGTTWGGQGSEGNTNTVDPWFVTAGDYKGSLEAIAHDQLAIQLGRDPDQHEVNEYVGQMIDINKVKNLRAIQATDEIQLPDENTPLASKEALALYGKDIAYGERQASVAQNSDQIPDNMTGWEVSASRAALMDKTHLSWDTHMAMEAGVDMTMDESTALKIATRYTTQLHQAYLNQVNPVTGQQYDTVAQAVPEDSPSRTIAALHQAQNAQLGELSMVANNPVFLLTTQAVVAPVLLSPLTSALSESSLMSRLPSIEGVSPGTSNYLWGTGISTVSGGIVNTAAAWVNGHTPTWGDFGSGSAGGFAAYNAMVWGKPVVESMFGNSGIGLLERNATSLTKWVVPGIGASTGQLTSDRIDATFKPEEFSWNGKTEALRAVTMFGAGVVAGRLLPEEGFSNAESSLFSQHQANVAEPLITSPSWTAAQITQPWVPGSLLILDALAKTHQNGTQPSDGQSHE